MNRDRLKIVAGSIEDGLKEGHLMKATRTNRNDSQGIEY